MSAHDEPCWIGTSWKMNKTLAEARAFANGLLASDAHADTPADAHCAARIRRFVVPPFTACREVKAMLADTDVLVGAQDMHWEDAGAWTGAVSAPMLVDCGLDLVELGHSERRAHFGETDETVGRKVAAAVRHGLMPLICIGETLAQRDAGRADEVLRSQVEGALAGLGYPATDVDRDARDASDFGRNTDATILFAYEPVWAIGASGVPATSGYADERQRHIKATAAEILGRAVPCLYGGSVNPDNCVELLSREHVDGLFIGRSAWQVDGYLDILGRCAASLRATRSPV